jgi:hypothetical protein
VSHRTTCGTTPHLIGSRGGKWAGLTPPPRIQGDLLSCVTITNSTHLTFVSAQFKQVLFLDLGAYILHRSIKTAIFIESYSGYTLRSPIEAPLITREVLPETYFLLVIMAADAQAGPFLEF